MQDFISNIISIQCNGFALRDCFASFSLGCFGQAGDMEKTLPMQVFRGLDPEHL